jgi:hypothetical protein
MRTISVDEQKRPVTVFKSCLFDSEWLVPNIAVACVQFFARPQGSPMAFDNEVIKNSHDTNLKEASKLPEDDKFHLIAFNIHFNMWIKRTDRAAIVDNGLFEVWIGKTAVLTPMPLIRLPRHFTERDISDIEAKDLKNVQVEREEAQKKLYEYEKQMRSSLAAFFVNCGRFTWVFSNTSGDTISALVSFPEPVRVSERCKIWLFIDGVYCKNAEES